ncbi:MAG: hypothetical protein WAW46_15560 [Polaromonas sp.]
MSFTLGQEEYGIDIQKVQELRGHDAVILVDLEKRMSNDDMDLNEKMAS